MNGLGRRQREALGVMRRHNGRWPHDKVHRSHLSILESLEARGLVTRDDHGWRTTTAAETLYAALRH